MEQKYIVALETGSSKIRGAIGCVDDSGILTVKAVEEEKLIDCVRYGCVRNVAEVSQAIDNILSRLTAREPGREITGIYVALGGKSTILSTGKVERRMPMETEITDEHVRRLTDEVRATVLNERDIVAVLPREFVIDGDRTHTPVGMFGRSIEATYNVVSCRNQLKRNLTHVLSKTNVKVHDMVPRQLALAGLVLTQEEKRLGCMLVDFGAETVTVSFYKDGVLLYLATLPMGSRNITRDITSLHHLEENAERLKKTVGNAQGVNAGDFPADGADYTDLNNLVAARAGEIIANINEQIKYAGLTPDDLPAGLIITGGGAKLKGFNRRLEQTTRLTVRTGLPGANVRITDSRIQPVDAVDVISILTAVARNGKSCMSNVTASQLEITPEPAVASEPEPEPEPEPEIETEPEPDDNQSHSGRLTAMIARLKTGIAKLVDSSDDDDYDFTDIEK